jgi:hypothetical protein
MIYYILHIQKMMDIYVLIIKKEIKMVDVLNFHWKIQGIIVLHVYGKFKSFLYLKSHLINNLIKTI